MPKKTKKTVAASLALYLDGDKACAAEVMKQAKDHAARDGKGTYEALLRSYAYAAREGKRRAAATGEQDDEEDELPAADMLTCGKCGGSDITLRQVQTRGADEAMTVFAVCAACGNRWQQ